MKPADPDKPGIYKVDLGHGLGFYAKWDGRQWHRTSSNTEGAAKNTARSEDCYMHLVRYEFVCTIEEALGQKPAPSPQASAPAPGPRKPVPAVPLEVFRTKPEVDKTDYMAAVRAMCGVQK
jgi:hypothetical protein